MRKNYFVTLALLGFSLFLTMALVSCGDGEEKDLLNKTLGEKMIPKIQPLCEAVAGLDQPNIAPSDAGSLVPLEIVEGGENPNSYWSALDKLDFMEAYLNWSEASLTAIRPLLAQKEADVKAVACVYSTLENIGEYKSLTPGTSSASSAERWNWKVRLITYPKGQLVAVSPLLKGSSLGTLIVSSSQTTGAPPSDAFVAWLKPVIGK